MIEFYKLLNSFINAHVAITIETKDRIDRILSYVKPFYNNYFDAYKKSYNNKELTDEDKRKYDYKQFIIIDNTDQGSKSTKKEQTRTNKPLWVKINKNDFE